MSEIQQSLNRFLPEVALTGALLLVVLLDCLEAAWKNAAMRLVTLAGLAGSLALCFGLRGFSGEIWSGMLVVDPLGLFFKALLVGASLLVALAFTFRNSRELHGQGQGEFYALLLALTLSNLLMAGANDLSMLYLALEMVS